MKTEKLDLDGQGINLDDSALAAEEDTCTEMRTIAEDILERKRKHGRYIVRDELARGGMGVIYVVYDQDLRRTTAMKVIPPQVVHQEQKIGAFVSESRITAQLEHPNIVPVHEIGVIEENGCPYYTMKLIQGEPLKTIIHCIADEEPSYVQMYNRYKMLDIFVKVCNAVAYAHSHGVIHRDIKPGNIMVGKFGEVLLMDWGLAKYIDAEDNTAFEDAEDSSQIIEHNPTKTENGVIKGSLAYIAPEQVFGDTTALDKQTDIFLLGSTLYQIFTYFAPYDGDNMIEILHKAERCDYVLPSEKNPRAQIPKALEQIILKAMAPVKANRYASVEGLIADIEAFCTGKRSGGIRHFRAGEDIIKAGEESKETFVVINGRCVIHRMLNGRVMTIAEIGPGEIVGEMAGITHSVRTATITAKESMEALIITHDLMLDELRKLPPWMEKIVFSLADRVRINSRYLHPLLLNNRIFPLVNQLFLVFASAQQVSDDSTPASYELGDVIDEVTMNLGLDMDRTAKVIDVLAENGLCLCVADRVSIPNLSEFALFNDYCRYKFQIAGGVKKINEIRLPKEQDSYFRRILRSLRKEDV
jgi:serine/threonine protein kinase